jgi:hypothetical protein
MAGLNRYALRRKDAKTAQVVAEAAAAVQPASSLPEAVS